MKATLLCIIVLLYSCAVKAQFVENIPLVDCAQNTTCFYQSAWFPNATINPNDWAYFSFDLSNLEYPVDTTGLLATILELSGGSTIYVYVADSTNLPDSDSYSSTNQTCFESEGQTCYLGTFLSEVGVCNAAKKMWYVSVQNQGSNVATFVLDVTVDDGSDFFFGCNYKAVIGGVLFFAIGMGICCLACIGGCVALVVCGCVCGKRKQGHVHCPEKGYNRLQPTVTTINYGATTTTLPPPPPYRLPENQQVYYAVPQNYMYATAPVAPTAPYQTQLYPSVIPQTEQQQQQ